jgi:hypothetical protein
MPSQEFGLAHERLVALESHWISLLLWFCQQTGQSPESLVEGLGDAGLTALNRYEQERRRAGITPVHFLAFPNYVELATDPANAARLAALGSPPADWKRRLNADKTTLTEFRNMLQHAARFDFLNQAERREAATLLGQQLDWLNAWWPAHPHAPQTPEADRDPLRAAVQMLSRDPRSAYALADQLGFDAARNPLNLNAPATQLADALGTEFGGVYQAGAKTPGGSAGNAALYLAYLKEWPERSAGRERYRRRVAKALVEANPGQRFLVILMDDRDDRLSSERREIEIVFPRTRAGRPFGTVRATIDPDNPTRHHRDLLNELSIKECRSLAEISRRWAEAFNVEKVTNLFYKEFKGLRDRLAEALIEHNPDNPELAGFALADLTANRPSQAQREFQLNVNAFATRQLSRLLFLWFLQQKGWLGAETVPGPRTFLVDLFRKKPQGDAAFYSERLTPLFFDALGLPAGDRRHGEAEALLGGAHIPYLDGGLFRPDADPFERDLFGVGDDGRPTRTVILPDALFDPVENRAGQSVARHGTQQRQRTVLGLLRGYRFTTQESTPDDQSVDPDPELLGKVSKNSIRIRSGATPGLTTPRARSFITCAAKPSTATCAIKPGSSRAN